MGKRLFLGWLLVGAMALIIFSFGCSQAPPPAASSGTGAPAAGAATQKKVNWKWFTILPLNHPVEQMYMGVAKEIGERTSGQLEITVYPGDELPYKGTDALRILREGNVEIAETVPAFVGGEAPILSLPDLPFLAANEAEANALQNAFVPIRDEVFDKYDAQVLFKFLWPFQQAWTRSPVSSLADLKGLKMRVSSAEVADLIAALGGSPATITTPEVYTALQRGTVQAAFTSATNLKGSKWDEVARYGLMLNTWIPGSYTAVSLKAFNALPESTRKIVLEVAQKWEKQELSKIAGQLELEVLQQLRKEGVTMTELSAAERQQLVKLRDPVAAGWAKRTGPGAQEALDKVLSSLKK